MAGLALSRVGQCHSNATGVNKAKNHNRTKTMRSCPQSSSRSFPPRFVVFSSVDRKAFEACFFGILPYFFLFFSLLFEVT